MHISKRFMAACLVAAAIPSLAWADDHYLRAGAGTTAPKTDDVDNSQAWTLGLGWRFSKYFSVEGGYNDLGDYEGTGPAIGGPLNSDITSLEVGMAAKIPFGRSPLFGQARVGVHNWEATVSNFETSSKLDGTDAYYGVGIGYDFSPQFGVVLSYERYATGVHDLDRVMLGFEMR